MRKIPEQIETKLREIDALQKAGNSPGLRKAILSAKKSAERALYRFVANGCEEIGEAKGFFPELTSQYNEESYDLLDKKIRVLLEITKAGPGVDYTKIDGFYDILENRRPGIEVKSFD